MWALDWLVCKGKPCSQVCHLLGLGQPGGALSPGSARPQMSKHQKYRKSKAMINTVIAPRLAPEIVSDVGKLAVKEGGFEFSFLVPPLGFKAYPTTTPQGGR